MPSGVGRRLQGLLVLAAGTALVSGCGDRRPSQGAHTENADTTVAVPDGFDPVPDSLPEPQIALVDTSIEPAVAGQDGWMYSRSAEADLDSDGELERVVLMARAEVRDGRPLWDDGQPWQVYVEESDGRRTYLYSRYVQLGSPTLRIGLEQQGRPPSLILLEHVPDRVSFYEIVYEGPGSARAIAHLERMVDPTGELASPDLP
ncbi:MAG TPA: hypothetical protein VF167_04535 [Longimicrobiaceae bacterium]